jgi:hypothetical protein
MEYYVQRHGDQAQFAYTVMSGCLIGVVLLGVAIYVLGVTGEQMKIRKAAFEAQLLKQAEQEETAAVAGE